MLEEEVYSPNSPIWSEDSMGGATGGHIPRGELLLFFYVIRLYNGIMDMKVMAVLDI